jgi:hypothetical protein
MSIEAQSHPIYTRLVALFLLAAGFAGVSTVSGQCRPELPPHLTTPGVIEKGGQVSGILEELAARRELFLKGNSMVDLFPALYYHSTETQFGNIANYDAGTAEAVLDLIILFYDAYRHNRMLYDRGGSDAVEKHWRKYYKNAPKLNRKGKPDASELVAVMLDGVDAHLTDLPRSLRVTFSRMPITIDRLRDEYFRMEAFFSKVSRGMNADMQTVIGGRAGVLSADSIFGFGTKYVILLRKRAWDEAVGGKKLKASNPQPELFHGDASRKYFSLLTNCVPL